MAEPDDTVHAWRVAAVRGIPDRIAFLGLGLIGGSVALALRQAGYRGSLAAWTPSGHGPAEAQRRGLIDEAHEAPGDAMRGAGLVILAGPPLAILEALDALAGPWRGWLAPTATITDVGSTKARIVAAADRGGLQFVGGHPMAGREATGVGSAVADLFVGRPWVIVPGGAATARDVERAEALAVAAGSRLVRLDAQAHDRAVAAISHLPLVLSAGLVEAVAGGDDAAGWSTARALAATGWSDMTRLARGDPEMGAGILATNASAIADSLRAVRAAIDAWIARLDAASPDADELRARLEAARAALAPTAPGERP